MSSLEIKDLSVTYGRGSRRLRAVDSVDLLVPSGSVVGLVGESGSGKSTVARAVVGLTKATGRILLDSTDLLALRRSERRRQGRAIQMVFQDPYGSLNPRLTIEETIAEVIPGQQSLRTKRAGVAAVLEQVELGSGIPARYPRELSGGQRQRVAIARALATQPAIIVADEITSALDVSVQAAILNLIIGLRQRLGLTLLFISHNLAVVRYVSDQVVVMKEGRIVERLPADGLTLAGARSDYARELIRSIPSMPSRQEGL